MPTDAPNKTQMLARQLDAMPGNYVVRELVDGEYKVVYVTKGVYEFAGVEPGLPGFDSVDHIFVDDRAVVMDQISAFLDSDDESASFSYRFNNETHGFLWIHAVISRFPQIDGRDFIVSSLTDVTEEMTSSHALLEAVDIMVCIIEKSTKRMLYANEAFAKLAGTTVDVATGRHCYNVLCGVPEMADNDNCLCFSSLNADPPIESYNPSTGRYVSLTGRELTWGGHDAYVFYLSDITKDKAMDAKLADAQKRFEVALDNSDLMIWEYDLVNHLCINSEKAGRDYNIPIVIENYPEALYQTGHLPPETIEQIRDVDRRLHAGETGFSVERRTINKYGKSDWQKVSYSLECDEDGKPIRAIVCGMDINPQKELERKFVEQVGYRNNLAAKALFSASLDLDDDVLGDYTSNEHVLNDIADDALSAHDFLTNFFSHASFDPTCGITHDDLTLDTLKDAYTFGRTQIQTVYRCNLLRKYLDFNLSMYPNPTNDHLELFFMVNDVTDSTLVQTALDNVLEKDYDSVMFVGLPTGTLKLISGEPPLPAAELNDCTYDELTMYLKDTLSEYFVGEHDIETVSAFMTLEQVVAYLDNAATLEFNYTLNDPRDGRPHTYRTCYSYADDAHERILLTRRDITDVVRAEQDNQRKLEGALRDARKANAAKTDFLSRMSHDMRTPMNGIIGMTRLTQDLPNLPDEAIDNLATIDESSAYLLQLINDTLDMNKIESSRFELHYETVDAKVLIHNILSSVRQMANEKGVTVEFTANDADLGYVRTDPMRVHQLALNVLSNSLKFTPKGGSINVDISCLGIDGDTGRYHISVADTGCGMSPEFVKHIFEPFSQEHNIYSEEHMGTGLGMAIVKNLVELMGGTVEVTSELGRGTTVDFVLTFELVDDAEVSEMQVDVDAVDLTGVNVLLAEDNETNALIATRLLEKRGVTAVRAHSGQEALDIFSREEPGTFDCILMDVRMPVMDGLEATQAIRKLDRADAARMPIIALTANAYADDVKAVLAAGMNAHVAKPFEPDDLYAQIAEQIELARA